MELIEDGQTSQDKLCNMLREVKGFAEFEPPDLEFIIRHMKAYHVSKGETIIREGDRNSCLGVVIEGRVGVYKEDSDGLVKYLTYVSPGRLFGEISVIENLPFTASLLAESDVTLILMSREGFRQCIQDNTVIGVKFLSFIAQLVCARLRTVSNQLVDYIEV
jgi:CRP-like cAMP-binding protein